MAEEHRFLAFDLGAESGRAVAGTISDGSIRLDVLHRFRTEGVVMLGTRQWDLARLYEEMITGLTCYVRAHGPRLDGIGVDTWGVDFGLLARDGSVIANPVHYRDKRNEGMQEVAFSRVGRERLYRETGIQFLPFNTVYQLLSLRESGSPHLEIADRALLMPDLLHYLLCGVQANEYTNASTTQLLDPHARTWNEGLFSDLNLPRNLFRKPVAPGTLLGTVLPEVVAATGISADTPVIAPGTHDTASAVAAVPVLDDDKTWAYLSSGTWSLLGAELDAPCISDASLAEQFTNEGGVCNTIRFLKNIFGLWLVQECRRSWERDGFTLEYSTLTEEAENSPAFVSRIDLDDPRLLAPDDMPELIRTLCREGGQPVPESRGALVRCALESLALKYRQTLRALDAVLGRKTERLHIIGGGAQNRLLCRMTADACGVEVVTGPVEATALGNIGMQALATGVFDSLQDMRAAISKASELETFTPQDTAAWDRFAQT